MRVRGSIGAAGLFFVLSLSLSQTAYAEGVTIAVHGWHVSGAAEPSWTGAIQSTIADQWLDGEQNFGKITVTGSLGSLTATCSPWDVDLSASRTGEIVVRIDWHSVADHLVSGVPAQDIAAVVAPKIYNGQNGEQPLAELPIHIMGHSRGGGMVCELARLLGEQGIEVDHVSPLDPHPLISSDPQPIPPIPPIIDTPVAVYENVLFIDNYWQNINYPEGEYVAGAYNREWTSIPGGYHNHINLAYRNVGDHHNITLMYHGTVDLNTPVNDGEATLGAAERASWYNTYETDGGIGGQRGGFYYSRINGESDRLSTETPVGGGDRIIDGYHDDPLLGGAGSRTGLTWSSAVWPNLVLLDILKDGTPLGPGDYYLSAGEALDLRYTYRDYDTGSDVTFYFDEDRNPYNANTIATISTHSHSASGASLVQATVAWDTSTLPSGRTGYVCAEITDGLRARYLCAMPRIHTPWEAPLPMIPPGSALDLDGADDYISLPAAISTPVESITVEAWVYSNALSQPSEYRAIVAEVDGGDGNVEFELFLDGGNHNLSAGFNDGSWHTINDADAFPTGEWVHVAATYDGHFMKLYRDGQQVAISSDLSLTLPDGVDGWRIGRSHDSGGVANLWNGPIDEVRVWGAARSESDIQSSMNIVLDGDETSLIAYYHFDHLSDSFLFDHTANDFHGTLANMADDDWVTSEAAAGHKSHVGTGIGNLGESTDVPVDIMWDDDPGAGAIFAAIQVDDEPDVQLDYLQTTRPHTGKYGLQMTMVRSRLTYRFTTMTLKGLRTRRVCFCIRGALPVRVGALLPVSPATMKEVPRTESDQSPLMI